MPKVTPDTMLSCSQLPAVMGHSKWAKPNDILQYAVTALEGGDPRTPAGEAADWGNLLEESILAEAAKRLGLVSWNSPTEPYFAKEVQLCCSLDAIGVPIEGMVVEHDPSKGIYVMDDDKILLDGPGILESKLTRGIPEESPPLYRGPIQIQGQMLCSDLKWAALAVLYSGIEMRIYLYKPHRETQEAIMDIAHRFDYKLKAYKASKEIPWFTPADSKDADRVWSHPTDDAIDLDVDAEKIAAEIVRLKEAKKEMEDQITQNEMNLKLLMQDFTKAVAGKYQINWPVRHYKATPEKITPAKEAYSVRQSTLTIKEMK